MTEVIEGVCLCGEVVFEMQASEQYGPDQAMGTCHCSRCQRWSGGSGTPFVVASPDHFKVIKGQELLAHYCGEGPAGRVFCRRCGSSLFQDAGLTYFVSAGVLKDLKLTPAYHVHVASKAPWDEIGGDAPQFAEMPTGTTEPEAVAR